MSAYCVPVTFLSTVHLLIHLIFATTLEVGASLIAKRRRVALFAQSHRAAKWQRGFKLRRSFLRAHILNPCAISSSCNRMISALIFSAHLSVTWPGRSSISRRPGHLTKSPLLPACATHRPFPLHSH